MDNIGPQSSPTLTEATTHQPFTQDLKGTFDNDGGVV